jgi:ABC-type multidrug transport system fused ATPase/permease subunit
VALVGADDDELRCLLSLPNRLSDPDKGEIRWDGVNLKLCRLESLRMGIGWVVSPFVVVGGTVIANIIGGRPGTSESEAEAVCRSTHLDRLARTLPEGLSTQVGPGGISLQPLQAYLIALSRALLGNPSLLILEEPDFELNTDERALVDDALNRAIEGRAVLLLARTAARLLACDHIFLIEHGHVSMHGSHENLLAKSAVYRHFYEHTLDGLHSAGKQKS